jgi:hypothetical protein
MPFSVELAYVESPSALTYEEASNTRTKCSQLCIPGITFKRTLSEMSFYIIMI